MLDMLFTISTLYSMNKLRFTLSDFADNFILRNNLPNVSGSATKIPIYRFYIDQISKIQQRKLRTIKYRI